MATGEIASLLGSGASLAAAAILAGIGIAGTRTGWGAGVDVAWKAGAVLGLEAARLAGGSVTGSDPTGQRTMAVIVLSEWTAVAVLSQCLWKRSAAPAGLRAVVWGQTIFAAAAGGALVAGEAPGNVLPWQNVAAWGGGTATLAAAIRGRGAWRADTRPMAYGLALATSTSAANWALNVPELGIAATMGLIAAAGTAGGCGVAQLVAAARQGRTRRLAGDWRRDTREVGTADDVSISEGTDSRRIGTTWVESLPGGRTAVLVAENDLVDEESAMTALRTSTAADAARGWAGEPGRFLEELNQTLTRRPGDPTVRAACAVTDPKGGQVAAAAAGAPPADTGNRGRERGATDRGERTAARAGSGSDLPHHHGAGAARRYPARVRGEGAGHGARAGSSSSGVDPARRRCEDGSRSGDPMEREAGQEPAEEAWIHPRQDELETTGDGALEAATRSAEAAEGLRSAAERVPDEHRRRRRGGAEDRGRGDCDRPRCPAPGNRAPRRMLVRRKAPAAAEGGDRHIDAPAGLRHGARPGRDPARGVRRDRREAMNGSQRAEETVQEGRARVREAQEATRRVYRTLQDAEVDDAGGREAETQASAERTAVRAGTSLVEAATRWLTGERETDDGTPVEIARRCAQRILRWANEAERQAGHGRDREH